MQVVHKKPYATPSYSVLNVDQTLTRQPCANGENFGQGIPQNGLPGLCS